MAERSFPGRLVCYSVKLEKNCIPTMFNRYLPICLTAHPFGVNIDISSPEMQIDASVFRRSGGQFNPLQRGKPYHICTHTLSHTHAIEYKQAARPPINQTRRTAYGAATSSCNNCSDCYHGAQVTTTCTSVYREKGFDRSIGSRRLRSTNTVSQGRSVIEGSSSGCQED